MAAAKDLGTPVNYDDIISKLEELPTLPSIVAEINAVINDPMSTVKDIENLMLKDQSLTTKVLKLINSAYYSIPGGISDLGRAIGYLGYDAIYQLVLATSVLQTLKVDSDLFDIKKFWQHSIGVAIAAETIAKYVKHNNPQEIFTAGLIHDIGKIALLIVDPDLFIKTSEVANKEEISFRDAEQKLETYQHSITGFILAEKWKIPANLCSCMKYHHTLELERRVNVTAEVNKAIDIVMFANLFMHGLGFGDSGYKAKPKIPTLLFERLNITDSSIKEVAVVLKEGLKSADRFLEIIGGES